MQTWEIPKRKSVTLQGALELKFMRYLSKVMIIFYRSEETKKKHLEFLGIANNGKANI